MKPFARAAKAMPGSGIREIVNIAVTMPEVIRLEVGEPNFPTPPHIIEGAFAGARAGFTRYTLSSGLLSLRDRVAEKVTRQNGRAVTAANITITIGAIQGIFSTQLALVEPGEEILVPDPAWPNCEMIALLRGVTPVRYPLYLENGFIPRIEDLERLVTDRTKLLIINSPSNPTGAVFPAETMRALVEFARRHDLYLLADEVYEELVYEGEHVSAGIYDPERVISIYSFSKTYAMTGWRIGYVVANEELSRLLMKLQEPLISSVPAFVQKGAEVALAGPQDCVREMREAYRERGDAVVQVLKEHGQYVYTPRGAFYIVVDISRSGLDAREFALALLREKHVAVAPGTAFGDVARHLVRVSLATEKGALIEGVNRLCSFVEELSVAGKRVPESVS